MNSSEDFDKYQKATATTAVYPIAKALEYTALGLCSEAGEVAGKVKKMIRDKTDSDTFQEQMLLELGDVLWYLARLADECGLRFSDVAEFNLDKLADRSKRNVIQGDGDNR